MKLFKAVVAFSFIFSMSNQAQAIGGSYGGSSSGTSLGFTGGFRYNNLEIPSNRAYNRTERGTTAFQGGLLIYFPVNENISLRLGALYVNREMEFTTPQTNPTLTGKHRLIYLDLPATLQVGLFGSSFYALFGQNIGIKVNDTCEVSVTSCSQTAAPFNITSIFGLGWYAFDIGSSGKFTIEAQYEYGMNNIFPAFQTNTVGASASAVVRFGI